VDIRNGAHKIPLRARLITRQKPQDRVLLPSFQVSQTPSPLELNMHKSPTHSSFSVHEAPPPGKQADARAAIKTMLLLP